MSDGLLILGQFVGGGVRRLPGSPLNLPQVRIGEFRGRFRNSMPYLEYEVLAKDDPASKLVSGVHSGITALAGALQT